MVSVPLQIMVFIVSETSGKSKNCANQLSLAYISNKAIMLVPRAEKETLFASLPVNLWVHLAHTYTYAGFHSSILH